MTAERCGLQKNNSANKQQRSRKLIWPVFGKLNLNSPYVIGTSAAEYIGSRAHKALKHVGALKCAKIRGVGNAKIQQATRKISKVGM